MPANGLRTDATPGDNCWQTRRFRGFGAPLFNLEVRVPVELFLVKSLHCLRFGERHPALLYGPLTVARDARVQLVGVIFHVLQDLVGGIAFDDLLDPPAAPLLEPDMD